MGTVANQLQAAHLLHRLFRRVQLFVGNDANMNSYSVGAALSNSQGQREDLIVGGKLQFPTGYVPNGNIVFGNEQSLIGTPVLNSFNVLNYARDQPGFFNFSAAGTCYRQQSTSYCGMSDSGYKFNGEVEFPPESPAKMVLKVQGDSDYQYALFKVTCDQLNQINEVGFDLPSDTTVVLNVFPGGEPGTCQLKFNHVYSARRLLLNTCGLSEVRLSGNLRASVLAIDANVIGDRGMMDGQLVARSYQGRMQHNNYLFQGCLPASR
jgi:choice-of-anchor A domain-containing protein